MFSPDEIKTWDTICHIHVDNLISRVLNECSHVLGTDLNIIDIGSNTGTFISLLEGRGVKIKNALLIEPVPELLEYSRNKFKNKNYIFKNIALSDKRGTLRLERSETPDNLGINIMGQIPSDGSDEDIIQVYSFDELNFSNFVPDIIKIDAEGMDFKVIQGMQSYIASLQKKPIIIAESNGYASISPENAVLLLKVQKLLHDLNYSIPPLTEWSTDLPFLENDHVPV